MRVLDLGRVVGMSAYELAVSNGYEGTLESWLESLRYDHSDEYKQFTETIEAAKQEILSGKEEIKLSMTQIRDLVEKSLTDIGNAKKAATEAVKSEETEAVSNINSTESAALSNIGDAETNALASLANTLDSAIRSINEKGTRWKKQIEDTGTLAKSEYNQNAIAKQKAFDDNTQKKQSAFDTHVAETQTTLDQHIKEKQDTFDSNAVQKTKDFDEHTEQIQADIGQIKEDLGDLESKVGVDKKSMILGNLNLKDGQFVESDSDYAMHSNIGDKISVEKGNIIKVDHSSFNISAFSVWDKTKKELLTGKVSDADGYVFKKDYEDICFKVQSFDNIKNIPRNICSIFGKESNVALFANASNQENVVESVRNTTNALRENVEKITPIGFLEKELIGFSGCMRKDRKIVDLSQYGDKYKHTNDIEVTEGEVYKITTKASINYPHFLLFDANKTFVASYYTITGKTDTSNIIITNYILTIPANVKYMVINTYDEKWKSYEQTYINCVGKENGLTKKYFAFGDSVCRGNHPDASKSDYAWVETFGKIMGMETHNMAIGGQGYMTTVYQEKAINTIKATDISNANLITLSFAINDASDTSCPVGTLEDTTEDSIIGCAYNCIKYIYDTVPTCQVVVCGSTPQNGMRSARLAEVNNQLKAMSEHYNIPFIDLSDCPINGFNGKKGGALTSDGTHFNDDGYKLLSQFMTGKLSALFGYRQPFLI